MSEMYGFWFDNAGKRLRKIEQWELKEAKRLWAKHADIRLGHSKIVTPKAIRPSTRFGQSNHVTHGFIAHQKEEE